MVAAAVDSNSQMWAMRPESEGSGVASRFSKNLLSERKKARMNQESLGRRASLHRTEIGLLERAGRVPQIDTLVKLAGALSVEPEAFLRGIE
jgi:transcriptional regulator with XRE-family HTH domain